MFYAMLNTVRKLLIVRSLIAIVNFYFLLTRKSAWNLVGCDEYNIFHIALYILYSKVIDIMFPSKKQQILFY